MGLGCIAFFFETRGRLVEKKGGFQFAQLFVTHRAENRGTLSCNAFRLLTKQPQNLPEPTLAPQRFNLFPKCRCVNLHNLRMSNSGIAFEITRGGEVVWEWKNPKRDEKGRRATIIRMDRYVPSFVEPILSRYAE